jgi:hypothetical protein
LSLAWPSSAGSTTRKKVDPWQVSRRSVQPQGLSARSRLASTACPVLPRRNADITINAQITGLFNSIPPLEYDAWLYDVVSPIMISLDYNCLSFYIKK